jgi:GntR family transcriptional repressor for pyruvate dehydrogenase complex
VPADFVRFEPVVRAAVSDAVFGRLRDAILTGRIAPGEALPGERGLAEQFGVARHALREALRRLEQVGLVSVSHGGATRVLDWRTHAGLEVLPELTTAAGPPTADVLRSVLEMRLALGRDAARLAARRISPDAAAELRAYLDDTEVALAAGADRDELADRYQQFWRLILLASDNLAYQLAYNSLVKALGTFVELARRLGESEVGDLTVQRRLERAITGGDPDAADAVAEGLISRMLRAAEAEAEHPVAGSGEPTGSAAPEAEETA